MALNLQLNQHGGEIDISLSEFFSVMNFRNWKRLMHTFKIRKGFAVKELKLEKAVSFAYSHTFKVISPG